MEKTTVRIEGPDISSLVKSLEERLGGYFEYSYNGTLVFVRENYFLHANESLLNVIIVFLVAPGESEVDIVSGGGPGPEDQTRAVEECTNGNIVHVLKEICASHHWSLIEQGPDGVIFKYSYN
jgi:hypothetical protein